MRALTRAVAVVIGSLALASCEWHVPPDPDPDPPLCPADCDDDDPASTVVADDADCFDEDELSSAELTIGVLMLSLTL